MKFYFGEVSSPEEIFFKFNNDGFYVGLPVIGIVFMFRQ